MKRIILAVLAIATLGVVATSCSKNNADTIIGKWQITNLTVNGVADQTTVGMLAVIQPTMEFKKDKTLEMTINLAIIGGDILVMPVGTYSVSGSNLTITPSADFTGGEYGDMVPGSAKIKKLDSKNLQLESTAPNEETGKNDVTVITFIKK